MVKLSSQIWQYTVHVSVIERISIATDSNHSEEKRDFGGSVTKTIYLRLITPFPSVNTFSQLWALQTIFQMDPGEPAQSPSEDKKTDNPEHINIKVSFPLHRNSG